MMPNRFQAALARVLRWEGGLVNHPNDPGGITNYGISLRFLEEKGIDVNGDGHVDAADIQSLTPEKIGPIYCSFFWCRAYDELRSEAVASYLFDMAVNMGQDRSTRIAQQAAGVPVDGKLGPQTVAALDSQPQALALGNLKALRAQFYRDLAARKPALSVFLKGWLRRAAEA
jgi:lysozyme family protein